MLQKVPWARKYLFEKHLQFRQSKKYEILEKRVGGKPDLVFMYRKDDFAFREEYGPSGIKSSEILRKFKDPLLVDMFAHLLIVALTHSRTGHSYLFANYHAPYSSFEKGKTESTDNVRKRLAFYKDVRLLTCLLAKELGMPLVMGGDFNIAISDVELGEIVPGIRYHVPKTRRCVRSKVDLIVLVSSPCQCKEPATGCNCLQLDLVKQLRIYPLPQVAQVFAAVYEKVRNRVSSRWLTKYPFFESQILKETLPVDDNDTVVNIFGWFEMHLIVSQLKATRFWSSSWMWLHMAEQLVNWGAAMENDRAPLHEDVEELFLFEDGTEKLLTDHLPLWARVRRKATTRSAVIPA